MSQYQPLLSSDTELDGPWDERTLKEELKHLKTLQQQERELYKWLAAGNLEILKDCAPACGLDIYKLTVEAVEKVPNMLQVLRAAFIQAIEWCILKKKVMQLEEYQAKQKQKTSFGTWPRGCVQRRCSSPITPTVAGKELLGDPCFC